VEKYRALAFFPFVCSFPGYYNLAFPLGNHPTELPDSGMSLVEMLETAVVDSNTSEVLIFVRLLLGRLRI
jgi:hypothetical protein